MKKKEGRHRKAEEMKCNVKIGVETKAEIGAEEEKFWEKKEWNKKNKCE